MGKSSASVDRGLDAQRVMDVVQHTRQFARLVDKAMSPSKTERGWILAAPSTKAAVVNAHLDAVLPTHAQGAIHVGNKDRAGESIDVAAEGVEPVEGHVVDNALVFANAAPSTDILHVLDGVEVEELRVLRDANAPAVARYSIRKGEGIASVRVEGNRVQALDKDGYVRIQSAGVFAVDAKGVRRDLAVAVQHEGDHDVLTASLDATGLEFPVVVDPAWATVASMKNPRQYAASVQLSTGKIMVAGGENFAAATNVVEQYDPATDTWSDMPSMTYNRSNAKLFAFPGGRALAVGGLQGLVGSMPTPATAPNELFDGTAWVAPAADPDPRTGAATYDLGDGRLLFIGGQKVTYTACPSSGSPSTCGVGFCQPFTGNPPGTPGYCSGTLVTTNVNTAETYNATTNTWASAGTLAGYPLAQDTSFDPMKGGLVANFPAVTLFRKIASGPSAGKYLVVYNSTATSTSTDPDKVIAQIFDPATSTWSAALPTVPGTPTVKARGHYGFTQLPSGKYLFVAGLGRTGTSPTFTTAALATSFTLDLSSATAVWTPAGVLRCARDRFATVPSSGKVHVTMGNVQPFIDPVKGSQYCNEEEYNEATDTWTVTQQSTSQGAPWVSSMGGPSGVVTCPDGCFLSPFPNGMSIFPYSTSGFGGTTAPLTLVDFGWQTFFPASTPDSTKIGTNPALAITSTGKMLAAGGKTTGGMSSDAELWTQMADGSDCSYVTGGGFGSADIATADCYHGWCEPDFSGSSSGGCGASSTKKCTDKRGAICANDYQCNTSSFGGSSPTIGCVKSAPTDPTGHCTIGAVCNTASDCGAGLACVPDASTPGGTVKRCSMFCTADAQCPSAKSHCVADYRGYTGSFCGSMPMVCSDDTHALCPATATVCPWGGIPGGSSTPQVCTSGKCYDAPTCTSASSCSTGLACHDYGPAGKRCYYQCSGDGECVSPPLVCGATSGDPPDAGGPADAGGGGSTFDFNPAAPCVTAPPVDAGSDTGSATDSGSTGTDSGSGGSDGSVATDSGSGGSDGSVATDSGSTATDSGSTATDSGSTTSDTGSTTTDSGSTTSDTGSTTTDSGSADDTGTTTTDSGSADDTGTTTTDSGSTDEDGGSILDDAGAIVPAADETGGCGCEVPGTGHAGTPLSIAAGVALAGLVIARRRRTR